MRLYEYIDGLDDDGREAFVADLQERSRFCTLSREYNTEGRATAAARSYRKAGYDVDVRRCQVCGLWHMEFHGRDALREAV